MKHLSIWATRNRTKAQIILVFVNILLVALAILLGYLLNDTGIKLPRWSMYVFLVIIADSFLFYPIRHVKKGIFKNTYRKRKSLEFIFLFFSFLTITFAVNRNFYNGLEINKLNAAVVHNVEHTSFVESHNQDATAISPSPGKTKSKFWRVVLAVLLTILVLAILLVLIYLSIIFSYIIYDAGGSAAAVLFVFFGFPLIFLAGAVLLIRHIILKLFPREKETDEQLNQEPNNGLDEQNQSKKLLITLLKFLLFSLAAILVAVTIYALPLGIGVIATFGMLIMSTLSLIIILLLVDRLGPKD